jgi:hypothetical protein
MNSAGLLRIREAEKVALPLAAATAIGILIGMAVGPWGSQITLWLLGAAGLLVLYILLLLRLPWGLLLLLMLLPFQGVDLSAGRLGFVLSPTRLILPGLVVAWLIYRLRKRESTEATPLNYRLLAPMVALLFLICLSIVFSQNRHASLASLPRLLECVTVFGILLDVIRTERLLNQSIMAICIAIATVGALQVYDMPSLMISPREFALQAEASLGPIRVASSLGDEPNRFAHLVAIMFPLLLYGLTVSRSKVFTWVLGIAGLVAVFGILLTLSRGGMLALLAGVMVSYRLRFNARLILLVALLALVLMTTPLVGIWVENIGARPESATKRLGLWDAGLRSALEFPLFGTGFGTFNLLNRYVSFDWPADLFEKGNPELNKSAHSLCLSLVAETGFLSLLFLGIFWWLLVRLLVKLSSQTLSAGMRRQWWLVQFLMGCSAALLVSRFFTTGFFVLAFWALLGILISASSIIMESTGAARTADIDRWPTASKSSVQTGL